MKALHLLLFALLPLSACQGPSSAGGQGNGSSSNGSGVIQIAQAGAEKGQINFRDPIYRRFTERFTRPAVLLADRIEVHGPADLFEHLAVRQDSPGFVSSTVTTPAGLRQELTRKPEEVGGEAFAQLDQWQLFALHKLIVIQAPDDQPVRILALGQAVFIPQDDSEPEIKDERINFTGQHGQQ